MSKMEIQIYPIFLSERTIVQALASQGVKIALGYALTATYPADQRIVSPRFCGSNLRKIQIPVVASPTETVYLIVCPIVVLQYGFVKPGLKKSEGLYRLFILFRSTVFTEESYNLFRIMCGNMILYASGF